MPSGRWTASILITSAPKAANECVAAGPAQNAVKSTTRTPASGASAAMLRRHRSPWRPDGIAVRAADFRRRAQRRLLGDRHQPRCARLPESRWVVDVHATRLQVVHVGNGRAVAERGERQPEQLPEFDDLVDGALPHPRVDALPNPVAVVPSADLESQLGYLGELRAIHHRGEVEPLLAGHHGDADVAVLGGFDGRHFDATV